MKRALVVLALLACNRTDTEPKPDPSAKPTPSSPSPLVTHARGIHIGTAPDGDDLAKIVKDASAFEAQNGRKLVVYVGATWCEPCQRFHKAAAAGSLDADFPDLTLLELDLDKDKDRLERAGYGSSMIPLFVRPNADGRASEKRFEGSIKGDGAVANISPRLKRILVD